MTTIRLPCAAAIIATVALTGPAQAEQTGPAAVPSQDQPALKPGANSFAESQARALLEARGYQNVSTLMNSPDGIWRGTATKDNKQVSVSVDYQGHVADH